MKKKMENCQKTIFLGLSLQILIAISVLKIRFITNIFETVGTFFVKLLEYTGAGISMLFGELGDTSVIDALKRLETDPANQRILHLIKHTLKKISEN